MKLFHLADLHLGKCIHGYSMIEMGDQPYWMEQLLKKADELKPDAVVISGDVYDRAVPSKEAVNLFDDFLTRFSERNIPVLIISGNHDSGTRLAFADKLLCNQGIYLSGEVKKEVKCVTLEDTYGPVHFWMVPYLFPAAVNVILNRDDLKDYDSATRALLEEQSVNPEERNVILSHQFVVAGGEKPAMGGSETTVGGIGQIDASVFDGFDYVALGHIHNAQKMGREQIRYAGSPLRYHFSEAGQRKGLTFVELGEKGQITVSLEELPVLHEMREVSGTMDELLQIEVKENSYIRAVICQEILPPQAVEMLRAYFAAKNSILMEVVRDYSYKKGKNDAQKIKDVRSLSLEELFSEFYSYQHQGELPEDSLNELVSFVAEQTRNGSEDESEKERRLATEKLIEYAGREA
ncbi:MAG: exonuclease SbcCD subunit D [Lachnospiraceae bacterium]|nr:exonuclease SbcCD subunit D [Lachnospiraceae bacterium]